MWYASRRIKRRVGLWLIIVLLGHFGLGQHDAAAFVLCFGADGHVAAERADHDHRFTTAQRDSPDAGVLASGESTCVDISVVSEDHGAHKPLPGPHEICLDAPPSLSVLTFLPIDERVAAPVFPPPIALVDPALAALRSVFLLI